MVAVSTEYHEEIFVHQASMSITGSWLLPPDVLRRRWHSIAVGGLATSSEVADAGTAIWRGRVDVSATATHHVVVLIKAGGTVILDQIRILHGNGGGGA